ncbi:MAG: diacylglycerol kinase [Spirochaetes bacterium]|nr:diacylglycerol kinase [Spirochaetota bacterium]MBU1080987.1 diacylglycerol kinase [Spirochaetota bacterium]
MDFSRFADGLRGLVEKTSLFGSDDLEAVLIANPRAGGFSRPARAAAAMRDLASATLEAEAAEPRKGKLSWRVSQTTGSRHATRMASEYIEEAAMKPKSAWLVVLACGDGTSLEFLDELSRAPDELRNRFTVLRLPMGTGNDGSDGRELADSLSRLVGHGAIAIQPVLRVLPAAGGPAAARAPGGEWRSFNIASVGLDAFVTNMTNRLKASLPGDSYKLWVDLASVFYDRIYPPKPMSISALGPTGAETSARTGEFLLVAMGVSGNRTYGSNKPILPDGDNVCAVSQMPLLRKLALKDPISSGRIRDFPEASLFSAETLEIAYGDRILVQMDGEAELLVAEDFPLRIEKTPPLIRHIARA